MERYDQLYDLYENDDTDDLRAYQDFVGVFPPVDSRVALAYWQDASDALDERKEAVREGFPGVGETFADLAAHATREAAFTAMDLLRKHDRGVNVLVLDVDETLRSAGNTDNEIPRETLYLLTELHDEGLPIVVCTGQTLENVKGFLIQGLGNELVFSGDVSVVYEAGSGVFTPGHGADTKRLLYEDLDPAVRDVFDAVRSRILSGAPADLRRECHLQGNEFNVTLKPNYETGSDAARDVVDRALVYELDLLGAVVAETLAPERAERGAGDGTGDDGVDDDGVDGGRTDGERADGESADDGDGPGDGTGTEDDDRAGDTDVDPGEWARTYYADADPAIRGVLEAEGAATGASVDELPEAARDVFERIDVAYYEADAAEIGSRELNKVAGVEAALDVLGVDDPFAFVMGDSKSDLRVMRWVAEHDAGISAAPEHASPQVLEHVRGTDDLVYDRGDAAEPLRTVYALDRLASLE